MVVSAEQRWKVRNNMKISILGTDYEVLRQTDKENPKLKEADGLCEIYSKQIILRKIDESPNNYDNIDEYKLKVLRHEIIHAFFAESGLAENSGYIQDETLVDWIARQFDKISKAFEQAGC